MKLDADKILNRDTVPVSDTRFLNISVNDEIFTPVGRIIEKLGLTEVPQLFQVLSGKLTLVGNRPLPENVIRSLSEIYPHAEERFIIRAGVTGPAQLVGREHLTDAERLDLEIAYCKFCTENYSLWRDVQILFLTAMIILRLRPSLKVEAVRDLITPRRGSASAKLMKEKNTD
jgi:lipopolysaccharide/colanic/teichoic acid biosynthesis glycosyltransferase